MKIAIVTSGFLPVPSTKGGAVETLCENFIKQNEIHSKVSLTIFSIYDEQAVIASQKYKNTQFIFIKSNALIDLFDKVLFIIADKIFRKKNSNTFRFLFRRFHFNYKVSKYLKKNNYEKVLLENHTILYLSLKLRKNYNKYANNYYYHCHNGVPGTMGCRSIIERTKCIISVSEFRAKQFKKDLRLKKPKTEIVLNSIDPTIISKQINKTEKNNLYKDYKLKRGDNILIYTGRVIPGKGIEEIIEALKCVKTKNIKLLVLGSSLNGFDVKNNFEKHIYELSRELGDRIIFTGFIPYEELYRFYGISKIAVLPSTIDDSAPLTIIEALNCGLPIITTDSGGIPEYVDEKCAIILRRDHNLIENIAQSIDMLLADTRMQESMSNAASRRAKALSLENYYNKLLNAMGVYK